MQGKMNILGMAAALCGIVSPALASAEVREDQSGLAVWIFLGVCALIIMAQLVPAILMLTGMIRGAFRKREKPAGSKAG